MKESRASIAIYFDATSALFPPETSLWIVFSLGSALKAVDARVAGPLLFANSNRGKVVSLASDSSNPIGDITIVPAWDKQDTYIVVFVVFGVVAMVGILTASFRFCCDVRSNTSQSSASKQVSIDTNNQGAIVAATNSFPKSSNGAAETVKGSGDLFDDEHEIP